MKVLKALVATFLAVLLLLGIFVFVARDEVAAIPDVHAAFYAKETCSCLYLIGQSADYCRGYGLQMFMPSEVSFDEAARAVEARTFWGDRQRARFVGSPHGCRLDPIRAG